MYYYNPWNLDYKQPFGAVKVGQAILLKFDANQTQVEVKCIIRRDFGKRYEFLMSRDESGFFTVTIPFDENAGLYFYYFEILEGSDWEQNKRFYGSSGIGGEGLLYTDENDVKPYQLTVFEKEDKAPAGIVKQFSIKFSQIVSIMEMKMVKSIIQNPILLSMEENG
ncbi:hypothetical protein ICE98_01236 [Lactococcus lactis]|nr:hypothetical protein [Lactococcus lactis]